VLTMRPHGRPTAGVPAGMLLAYPFSPACPASAGPRSPKTHHASSCVRKIRVGAAPGQR
jgi:hypothetical protein